MELAIRRACLEYFSMRLGAYTIRFLSSQHRAYQIHRGVCLPLAALVRADLACQCGLAKIRQVKVNMERMLGYGFGRSRSPIRIMRL